MDIGYERSAWRQALTVVFAVALFAVLVPVGVQAAATLVNIQDPTNSSIARVDNGALRVGTGKATIPVQDLTATEDPVQEDEACGITAFLGCGTTLYSVPSGKRLVIEEVTLHVTVPKGQKIIEATITTCDITAGCVFHYLTGQNEGTSQNGANDNFAYTHQVRLYADSTVAWNVLRNSSSGTLSAQVTMSGYQVPA